VCWGDAGCWSSSDQNDSNAKITWNGAPKPYYVVGHYHCIDNNDGQNNGNDCIASNYADSCAGAFNMQSQYLNHTVDPCVICTPQIHDSTQHWSGKVNWTQGGLCADMTP
jgi:hypothetical protein